MNKLVAGQKIFVKPIGNAARRGGEIREEVIDKVGKKYFTLVGWHRERFNNDTLRHDGGQYTPNYQCYFSMQEISDERERSALLDRARRLFSSYGEIGLTLNELRQIDNIIKVAVIPES